MNNFSKETRCQLGARHPTFSSQILVIVFLIVIFTTNVHGQEIPAMEVSAAYTLLRDDIFDNNWPGWTASLTANYSKWLGFMAEASGTYKQTSNLLFTDRCYLGGPTFSVRKNSRTMPFARFLLGACHLSAAGLALDATTTELAIQPGGGLDFWVHERFAIRVGGDYRRIFEDGGNSDNFRFQIGVVIGLGTREGGR